MDEQTRQAARNWTLAMPVVSAYILSVVRKFDVRDEVLQNTAVAVIESFESYDPERSFQGWAMGIARNQIRLYYRTHARDRLVFDENLLLEFAQAFEKTNSQESTKLGYVKSCLEQLEGRARKICKLRYTDDYKPAKIAESTGMTANSVAKALQRIREQIRACIERKAAMEGGDL